MESSPASLYTFHDLVRVWTWHRAAIVWTFLLTLVPGLLVVFLMPRLYEGQATLLVSRQSRAPEYAIKATQNEGATLLRNLERKEEVNTETELLKSRKVIESVVVSQQLTREKLNYVRDFRRYVRMVYDWTLDTATWVYDESKYALHLSHRPTPDELRLLKYEQLVNNAMGRVDVRPVPDSSVLELVFKSSDPVLARDVTNAIVTAYLSARSSMGQNNAEAFFMEQAKRMAGDLQAKELELEGLKRQFSVYSADDQRRQLVAALVSAETNLKNTRTSLASAQARVTTLRSQIAAEPATQVSTRETTRNPNRDHLAARIVDMENQRTALAQKFQPDSTTIKIADAEIAEAKRLMESLDANLSGTTVETTNPVRQSLDRDLLAAQVDVSAREVEVQSLSHTIDSLRNEIGALNENEVKLKTLERTVSTQADAYVLYTKDHEQARVSQDMTNASLADVRVMDTAALPISPVRPKSLIYCGIVVGAALLLAAFAGFAAAYHDTSVASAAEAAALVGAPVIAHFPVSSMSRSKAAHA